ncbi:MAG: enoyl-CoA hydratase/isomerase family protein [Burkholderiales bacterium]|jgi:enoyl-CoA hydratase/carnithine racemase|nr:enoyl-CoA hydratase/isomerase family protein [Burkholderiales bacterium]
MRSEQVLVKAEKRCNVGVITLNRPNALNALSLSMIRDVTASLLEWRDDAEVVAVVLKGATQEGKGVAFCAGGDIRFFYQAALDGDPRLEDFFTEEYTLNHLIHTYPKLTVALMDGIVMGGGMGLSQGAAIRVVTERSKLAMPETNIGLFPDVGGGYFLSRCEGRIGEYLALTGQVAGAGDAIALGLADFFVPSGGLAALVETLCDQPMESGAQVHASVVTHTQPMPSVQWTAQREAIDLHFAGDDMRAIFDSLQGDSSDWAAATLATLRKRSPLMMAVTLEQVRRARTMDLADDLRMERDIVRHSFHLRPGVASETVEGIRALSVDKDHAPRWNPARIEDVKREDVEAYFASPWPAHAHPLRMLD